MILTGKARKDCLKHHNVGLKIFLGWRKHLQQALIIDWLDSVGLRINVSSYERKFDSKIFFEFLIDKKPKEQMCPSKFKSRHEATEAAIKLANDLYNGNK